MLVIYVKLRSLIVVIVLILNIGTDAYRCVNIRIELAVKFWTFECTEYIACPLLCTSEMEL
jgi:hypothetical protein